MEFDGILCDKNLDAVCLKLHVGFHSFVELSLTRLFLILFCAWKFGIVRFVCAAFSILAVLGEFMGLS